MREPNKIAPARQSGLAHMNILSSDNVGAFTIKVRRDE